MNGEARIDVGMANTGNADRSTVSPDSIRRHVHALKRKYQEETFSVEDEESQLFWAKKVEHDLARGKHAVADARQLAAERQAELERVRARRAQNERERAERLEGIGDLERMRLAAEAAKEAAKEEQFHLRQSIDRAARRLSEGRAHVIDRLIQVIHLLESHPMPQLDFQPHQLLEGLRMDELKELESDVQLFRDLDCDDPDHAAFWSSAMDLVQREHAAQLNGLAEPAVPGAGGSYQADSGPVGEMVEAALAGSLDELNALQDEVDKELADPDCPDPAFWDAIRPRIAKRKSQRILDGVFARKQANASHKGMDVRPVEAAASTPSVAPGPAEPLEGGEGADALPEWLQQSDGRLSPPPVCSSSADGHHVLDEEHDKELLLHVRQQVQDSVEQASGEASRLAARGDGIADATQVQQALMAMGGGEGEDMFSGLVPLESRHYWWREKHKPRKPKFFNKVHTGYDWNKYNRAHYDVDNPPPKVVQGYKFNIFYPDLLDQSQAPTYKLIDDPSGGDVTKLLTFSAGPPYEDIAFRIVNKEWDRGPRKGFKSVFDRGMLQVYFNFKRTPYKR